MRRDSRLRIAVAGRGCGACQELLRRTKEACAAVGLDAEVAEIRDPEAIQAMGVDRLPALLIGDRLVCQGFAPSPSLLQDWLREASEPGSAPFPDRGA
ncbi:MAG: thioredoxin family protein [Acidobacteriota bacterium]